MSERVSMVVFSGTVDKLYPVAIMASGSVAMGKDVDIFLTFWGLMAFKKGQIEANQSISADYAEMGPEMMKIMQEKNVPSWYSILKEAKELGNIKIHACGMTMDLFDLTLDDLDDIVDRTAGVAEFIREATDGEATLFI